MKKNESQELHIMSFWAINGILDRDKLKTQLMELKSAGMEGVVFHPRFYPNRPEYLGQEYMEILSELILFAQSIGMEFWIYDENGWPSGTANGLVMKNNPQFRTQWLVLRKEGYIEAKRGEHILSFTALEDMPADNKANKEIRYSIDRISIPRPSSLDAEACEAFIRLTHDRYEEGLEREAFDYVTGFFSDEVHFPITFNDDYPYGVLPWTERLPKVYESRYGENLLNQLPSLFLPLGNYRKIRIQYWELVTDLLIEGFYKPLNDWGRKKNKKMTAHLKGEENPVFQVPFNGSCTQVLKHIMVPGIDALERFPGNNFFPRIAYSIAQQFGNGDCLAEAFGGSGWGASPEDFVRYLGWLKGHGITHYVIHLNQYQLKSSAVRDWPPSIPSHMSWKEAFSSAVARVKELPFPRSMSEDRAEILIIIPSRGVMAEYEPWIETKINVHNGKNAPEAAASTISNLFMDIVAACYAAGIEYEFADERMVEMYGSIEDSLLVIGNRRYGKVLIPDSCRWNSIGEKLIENFKSVGGEVWTKVPAAEMTINHTQWEENNHQRKRIAPVQSEWIIHTDKKNVYVPDMVRNSDGKLETFIEVKDVNNILITLLDEVLHLKYNGQELKPTCAECRYFYSVPENYIHNNGTNLLEIYPDKSVEVNPIVHIEGNFAVISMSPYLDRCEREVMTEGPFLLKRTEEINSNDLLKSGLPFYIHPVHLTKQITLTEEYGSAEVVFAGVYADAIRLKIDGGDRGWCWGPDWSIPLGEGIGLGKHVVEIELYPSTFNLYGPHHYVDGDRHIISPAQYEGIKNFADRDCLSGSTHDTLWRFVKSGLENTVTIQIHS